MTIHNRIALALLLAAFAVPAAAQTPAAPAAAKIERARTGHAHDLQHWRQCVGQVYADRSGTAPALLTPIVKETCGAPPAWTPPK